MIENKEFKKGDMVTHKTMNIKMIVVDRNNNYNSYPSINLEINCRFFNPISGLFVTQKFSEEELIRE
jgi:uncharacterized protein YodC (DUF2158 family)